MSRSYRMLCPITRALDHVGDRWTLLILRDLFAGPMRFGDLQKGLPGLASNLLTSRLETLQSDGLITRDGPLYSLTEAGRKTDRVLWELARLGMSMPVKDNLKRPGHLRLVAVTLQSAMRLVLRDAPDLVVALILDGEPLAIRIEGGEVTVRYGMPEAPQVTARTGYEAMMAAAGGAVSLAQFRAESLQIEGEPAALAAFVPLMTRVMTEGFAPL